MSSERARSIAAGRSLELAVEEARRLKHLYVGAEQTAATTERLDHGQITAALEVWRIELDDRLARLLTGEPVQFGLREQTHYGAGARGRHSAEAPRGCWRKLTSEASWSARSGRLINRTFTDTLCQGPAPRYAASVLQAGSRRSAPRRLIRSCRHISLLPARAYGNAGAGARCSGALPSGGRPWTWSWRSRMRNSANSWSRLAETLLNQRP